MDDGRLLVSIRALPSCGLGQSRVGCTERNGDVSPREMIAQWRMRHGQNAAYRPAWSVFIGMKNSKLSTIVQSFLMKNKKPKTVQLAVGELIADEELLQQEWVELTSSSALKNTKLNIRIIPAEQQCMWCFHIYHPKYGETKCPQCRSVGAKILSGEEFYLVED